MASSSSSHRLAVSFGHAEDQGVRRTMEDAFCAALSLAPLGGPPHLSLFCVFDGHAGAEAAHYAKEHLPRHLSQALSRGLPAEESLSHAFLETDAEFCSLHSSGGTTAAVVLVDGAEGVLTVAHAGDSRVVLCRDGEAFALTEDHRPDRESEVARVEAAGGVVHGGMVKGMIAVSRSIGDLNYKFDDADEAVSTGNAARHIRSGRSMVLSSSPDLRTERLTPRDSFAVIACDGVFDVFSSEDLVREVKKLVNDKKMADEAIAREIVEQSLDRETVDNVTVLFVRFKWGESA
jgi:protein phosphatase 2C family protein 2/3